MMENAEGWYYHEVSAILGGKPRCLLWCLVPKRCFEWAAWLE